MRDVKKYTDFYSDSIDVFLEGAKVTISLVIRESEIMIRDFEYRISEYLVGKKGLNHLISKSMGLPRFVEVKI